MKCRTEEEQCIARHQAGHNGVSLIDVDQVGIDIAAWPKTRAAILPRERTQWPHHIHEIFDRPLWTTPHVLVAMRGLRERAGVDFNRLRKIEGDAITPWQKHSLDDSEHAFVHHKRRCLRRTGKQCAEPLGPWSVEISLAHGCRGKACVQPGIDPRDQRWIRCLLDDAIAIAGQ